MLSPEKHTEVLELLKADRLSQRQIAHRTGVSRGTVAAIYDGRRRYVPPHDDPLRDEEHPFRRGPVERCPTCGARVYLPCVLCKVRAEEANRRADRRQGAAGDWRPGK